ncbi:MAG TPA: RDD family protein [Thermoanaerobaculia bacterium]|nr:RDD family protein [Thermoanaerobaculia bacterium]
MSQPLPMPTVVSDASRFPAPARELASAGQRFLASFLDGIVAGVPAVIPIAGWIWAVLYIWTKDALPFLGGQSVGKKVLGLRVVNLETGKPIKGDYGAAITRQLSLAIPLFNIVDACMVFSAERRRFGDKWAKTVVVKNNPALDQEAKA